MDAHQRKLIEAAAALGISVTLLRDRWRADAVLFEYGGHREVVFEGRVYSGLSAHTDLICADKHITKEILRELGIPCPASIVFRPTGADAEIAELLGSDLGDGRDRVYVCKPLRGTDGHGVAMNLARAEEIIAHARSLADQYQEFLLEEQIAGRDLRIQAVGGRLVAACIREPAFVTADGNRSLEELIAEHNRIIQAQNPHNLLVVDDATRELMAAQELSLATIPEACRKVRLKYVANMGQGGVAIDVTDALHPRYEHWVAAISARLAVRTFALDAITTDVGADPIEATRAIELNACAQWLHHTFSRGRTHDIPTMVLRDLFCSVLT